MLGVVRLLLPQLAQQLGRRHIWFRIDDAHTDAGGRSATILRKVRARVPRCGRPSLLRLHRAGGFTMKVDTPYSDTLQLADCISCGRCVTECPTGHADLQRASFELGSRVDGSRCIHVPPVYRRLPGRRAAGSEPVREQPPAAGWIWWPRVAAWRAATVCAQAVALR